VAENPRIDDLRKRLEREPASRLFAQLSEELRKEGDLLEAIRVARDGLEKHPNYPSARMTLGRALMDNGDLAAARTEFEAVIKGAPDNILASRFLAECLDKLGDLQGALSRYKTTLMLSPGDKQLQGRVEEIQGRLKAPPLAGAATGSSGRVVVPPLSAASEPAPIPLVAVDDDEFEVERSFEAGGPPQPAPVVARPEPPAPQPPPAPVRELEPSEFEFDAAPTLPFQPAPRVLLQDEPPPEPAPPPPIATPEIASPTIAELYYKQGFVEKAADVYRVLIEREPANQRARARLRELEALSGPPRPAAGGFPAPAPSTPATRRVALERTIVRLEGLMAAFRKG